MSNAQTTTPQAAERDWGHEAQPFRRRLRASAAELHDDDADGTIILGRAGHSAFGHDSVRRLAPKDLAPEGSPHHAPDRARAWALSVHRTRDLDALRTHDRAAGADPAAARTGASPEAWAHDDHGQDRVECQDTLATILRVGGPDVRALLCALAPEATGAEPKDDGTLDAAMTHRNGARGRSVDDARVLAYGWQGRVAARLGISRHTLARRIDALRRDFGAYVHAATVLGRGLETGDPCAC